MKPVFFANPADLRRWFEKHHATERELLVGFYKKGSGKPSVTWPQSVDEALCVGWIDGIRRSVDEESYTIRFTPRRARSIWSAVNIRRARALAEEGRMNLRAATPSRRAGSTGPGSTPTSRDATASTSRTPPC